MRERPILFSAPMVRAILAGKKTQTRRVVKMCKAFADYDKTPSDAYHAIVANDGSGAAFLVAGDHGYTDFINCPYGKPGDRLWVRETWQQFDLEADTNIPRDRFGPHNPLKGCEGERSITWAACYRADGELDHLEYGAARWRPGIHMPRWASRITLEVTGVRVERLHDIDELGALAEGVEGRTVESVLDGKRGEYVIGSARDAFVELWREINGAESLDANPWVWVVEFRRVEAAERAA